ncbi:MAG TPA: hypothetical protein VJ919_14320, partial [Tangfeifania sp.]|nr:hypothetical protein [Tangfeifania sp.]
MQPTVSKIKGVKENQTTAFLIGNTSQLASVSLTDIEKQYIEEKLKEEQEVTLFRYPDILFFHKIKDEKNHLQSESARKAGATFFELLKKEKIKTIQI